MMKRIIMTMAAALIMTSATMAQSKNDDKATVQDRTEKIQKRTDATVKRYNLNEEQAKKLLELNTKYDGKMRVPGMQRYDRRGMGMKPMMADSCKMKCTKAPMRASVKTVPMKKAKVAKDSTMLRRMRPVRGGGRAQLEAMQAYDKELQTIMTPEQYKQYKEDMRKRNAQGVHTFKNKAKKTEK